jgi:hypothetical protein
MADTRRRHPRAARGRPRGIEVLNAGVVSYSPKLYDLRMRWLLTHDGLDLQRLVVFLDVSDIHDEVLYEAFVPRADDAWVQASAWWRAHSLVWQLLERFVFARSAIDNRFVTDAGIDEWMRSVDAYRKPVGNPDADAGSGPTTKRRFARGASIGPRARRREHDGVGGALPRARHRARDRRVSVAVPDLRERAGGPAGRFSGGQFCEREQLPFVDLFPVFVDPVRRTAADVVRALTSSATTMHWNERGPRAGGRPGRGGRAWNGAMTRSRPRAARACPVCRAPAQPRIDLGDYRLFACARCGCWSSDALVRGARTSFVPDAYFANAAADRTRLEDLLRRARLDPSRTGAHPRRRHAAAATSCATSPTARPRPSASASSSMPPARAARARPTPRRASRRDPRWARSPSCRARST